MTKILFITGTGMDVGNKFKMCEVMTGFSDKIENADGVFYIPSITK